jgi:uncharacterized protein
VVIGSDGVLYKCTADFTFEQNKVGVITLSGDLEFNDNHYLWLTGIHEFDKKCQACFFGACCLSLVCPAARIRGSEDKTCSFEKNNLGLFLELFNREHFNTLEGV